MIRVDVVQGTAEWLKAKAGIVSASNMHRVITPKTMKPSGGWDTYCHELIAEQLLGRPLDDATTQFMQRGNLLEKSARDWYSLQRDVDVEQVGFLLRDDHRAGCSPDGLVGDVGGVEIKCPAAATHIGYMLDGTEEYRCQIQSSLLFTGRQWWDFVSYNPELPPVLERVERDEAFITKADQILGQFLEYVEECKERLHKKGLFPDYERAPLRIVA